MKAAGLSRRLLSSFRLHPSSLLSGRRSQVVRQRSAKPLFIGSIPIAASNLYNKPQFQDDVSIFLPDHETREHPTDESSMSVY